MVHLRVTKGKDGEDLTPILWSDNYFSLLPGERRDIVSHYDISDLNAAAPILKVNGYNIAEQSLEPR
jgi:exo-1,4-beta-D-glucosaminidase